MAYPKRVKINGEWYDVNGQDLAKWMNPVEYKMSVPFAHLSNLYHVHDLNGNKVGEIDSQNRKCSGAVEDFEFVDVDDGVPPPQPPPRSTSSNDNGGGCLMMAAMAIGWVFGHVIHSSGGQIGLIVGTIAGIIYAIIEQSGQDIGSIIGTAIGYALVFAIVAGIVGALIGAIVEFITNALEKKK